MHKILWKFVQLAKKEIIQNDFECIFSPHKKIMYGDGTMAEGFLDVQKKLLKCASKAEKWGEIFLHEYNHFIQYLLKTPHWKKYMNYPKDDFFFDWILGKKYNEQTLSKTHELVRNVELECERMTVQMIKKNGLPINLEQYIKTAAAYVYFYNFARKYRVWYKPECPPNKSKNIMALMPKTLNGSFTKMPHKILKAYESYYLNDDRRIYGRKR